MSKTKNQKKILHIITDKELSGAGQHMLTLFSANDPTFAQQVLLPTESKLEHLLKQKKISYVTYSPQKPEIKAIKQAIRKASPDIIHTHSLLGRIAARKAGRFKRIHTQQEVEPAGFFARLIAKKLSHAVIATSMTTRNNLTQTGTPAAAIRMIYNGAPPVKEYSQNERINLRKKLQIPKKTFVVLCTAKLTNAYEHILDTAKEMPYNVYVLIAGDDGGYKANILARVKEENLQNVKLYGTNEIDELFAVSDIQINLSLANEPIPAPILSGMSVGKPTISTTIDSHIINYDTNGIIITLDELGNLEYSEALDEAITRLKDDQTLHKKLSEGAKTLYNKRFTAKQMVTDVQNIYKELM